MRRTHLLLISVVLLASCTTRLSTAASPALQSWLPLLGGNAFAGYAGGRYEVTDDEEGGGEEGYASSLIAHLQALMAREKGAAAPLRPELSVPKSALWASLLSEGWLGAGAAGGLQKASESASAASGIWLQARRQLQAAADAAFGQGNRAAVTLASAVVASFMLTAMLPAR